MKALLMSVCMAFDTGVLLYVFTLNSSYLLCTAISFARLAAHRRRWTPREVAGVMRSPATPGISIIVPAHNEELSVVESVRGLLALKYPEYEIVVVNDGSSDGTMAALTEAFDLVKAPLSYEQRAPSKPVVGLYRSLTSGDIVVVDKVNGRKADAINAGLNAARYPLVCVIDADSLLDEDALIRAVLPFIEDQRTIAVGGTIRVVNGSRVAGGRVADVRLPRNWIARFQTIEYLRAFLAGRVAHSALDALLVISGAFGLFDREVVIEAGGYCSDSVGEDMELVARLHRHCRERKRPYRIVFLPDPVCWTEVPESARILGGQRNRWHRGTLDVLKRHGTMSFQSRYGAVGLLAFPYYTIFEAFGPVVEVVGYFVTIVGLVFGLVNLEMAKLLFLAAVVYGTLVSVGAVLLDDVFFFRYRRFSDVAWLIVVGIVENFGYRQLTTWWRLRGWLDFLRRKGGWGVMTRKGFART